MNDIVVLKFGSSVLRTPEHLPDAVHEIYRYLRQGQRIIAVVSAFEGETSRLLREAERYGPRPEAHALASWIATGEQTASAQLALCLNQFGVTARLVDPRELGLEAAGTPLDAEPVALSSTSTEALFASARVLVLPGYFATDRDGRCMLLGRGGSDNSALFVAHRLGAGCVLLKDVHGIYDHDPQEAGPPTHRFEAISWADAAAIAGKLVQPKALRYAWEHGVPFRVAAVAHPAGTTVGPRSAVPVAIRPPSPPLRVVLLGHGVVGAGVYGELERRPDLFTVIRIAVRHRARHVAAGIDPALLTTDPVAAAAEPTDLVVDTMGDDTVAAAAIERALSAGRSVVSSNKRLVARWGAALASLGATHGASLRYSAAVGGAVPMLELTRGLTADAADPDPIVSIRGVVNGTCNFVLDQLESGTSLVEAVALAQANGFAEADPSADLSGADAAAKLALLAAIALATPSVPEITFSGLDESAAERAQAARRAGRRLRLVAHFERAVPVYRASVGLEELEADDWLARCVGEENGIEFERRSSRVQRIRGLGAGRLPTTVSVMADVYDAWREFVDRG